MHTSPLNAPSDTTQVNPIVPGRSPSNDSDASLEYANFDACIQTPAVYSSALLDETNSISQIVQDLQHITKFINQSILSFSFMHLLFDRMPKGSYISPETQAVARPTNTPNLGSCKLKTGAPENASILEHEHRMFQVLIALQSFDPSVALESTIMAVRRRITDELQRINSIKAGEWERQCSTPIASPIMDHHPSGPVSINTDAYFHQIQCNPAMLACYFLVLVLSLLCGISREKCNFVLSVLQFIAQWLLATSNLSPMEKALLIDLP
ncbi:hypothetical protein EDB19DRAFT_1913015 [Suillus lakei]|nr:hypothetical protein EDB19DRAFT_1913015 [Suillus lakei]